MTPEQKEAFRAALTRSEPHAKNPGMLLQHYVNALMDAGTTLETAPTLSRWDATFLAMIFGMDNGNAQLSENGVLDIRDCYSQELRAKTKALCENIGLTATEGKGFDLVSEGWGKFSKFFTAVPGEKRDLLIEELMASMPVTHRVESPATPQTAVGQVQAGGGINAKALQSRAL